MRNGAAEPHDGTRGPALLIEHVEALDHEVTRPTAHQRLEGVLGGYLARLLITALSAGAGRARSGWTS